MTEDERDLIRAIADGTLAAAVEEGLEHFQKAAAIWAECIRKAAESISEYVRENDPELRRRIQEKMKEKEGFDAGH